MSGKPAARQGDMTQYGGPIVQGSAGVRIGAPTRRGVLGVSGRDDFGQPGKSAAGGEGAAEQHSSQPLSALWQVLPEDVRLSPHVYLATNSLRGGRGGYSAGQSRRVPVGGAEDVLPATRCRRTGS